MSRAFVKEPDGDAADSDLLERPLSTQPNYVTARGLALLRAEQWRLEQQRRALRAEQTLAAGQTRKEIERDLRYVNARLASAQVVERGHHPTDVGIGSRVDVIDEEDGTRSRYGIVGEDEADIAAGLVSWVSPLACAVLGAQVGDVVTWQRPDGARELEVVGIVPLDLPLPG